jgi:DNA-binding transcriptional LysR family regulator
VGCVASRYSDWLRAGRSGDRIPVGTRFFAPVRTGRGTHPASCTMCTVSFPGVKSGRGVTLTPHPLLVPWSRKGKVLPLLPQWAVRPVQSLSACTRAQSFFLRGERIFHIRKIHRGVRRVTRNKLYTENSQALVATLIISFFKPRWRLSLQHLYHKRVENCVCCLCYT